MSCQNCVRHVTEALQRVDGVVSAEVSLETATARVTARGPLSLDALTAAVKAAGYAATA
jgi:copper chaperone CopZ